MLPSLADRRALLALALAASGISACKQPPSLKGTIIRADGSPVAGASVSIVCDGAPPRLSTTSDDTGSFSMRAPGCIPRTCLVKVLEPNGIATFLEVGANCISTTKCGDDCAAVSVDVDVEVL